MIIGNPMVFPQLPIEDALERMRELGYEGIEVVDSAFESCRTEALKGQFAARVQALGLTLVRRI